MKPRYRREILCPPGHASQDLKYMLFSAHISLEPMKILKERIVQWGSWTVSFYILGSSHAMCLSKNGRHFMELFSCVYPDHDENWLLETDLDQGADLYGEIHGMKHAFKFGTIPITTIEPYEGRLTDNNWLEHAYGSIGREALAWTQIRWTLSEAVHLETVHTYPREGITVYSKTTVSDNISSNPGRPDGE